MLTSHIIRLLQASDIAGHRKRSRGRGNSKQPKTDRRRRLAFQPLEDRALLAITADSILTGTGYSGGPHVKSFDAVTLSVNAEIFAYDPGFTGGVHTAAGDVNEDGTPDIVTSPGLDGGPHIKVFSGISGAVLMEFFAYDAGFKGGVNMAVGDVNGDGQSDIITAPAANGGPHVKVFSGADGSLLREFFAYDPGFTGGLQVAAGDIDNDGRIDIITAAGPGGGPHVRIFSPSIGALRKTYEIAARSSLV